jgi:prepilin-type N-terminal cleavage/methylation domain-containing protein
VSGRVRPSGFSLVELSVVLLIGVVVMFSLLPVTTGLLRQQAGLDAKRLSVEMFPLLFDRLSFDLAHASSVALSPPFASPAFRLSLTPRRAEDPEVSWTVVAGVVSRTNVRRKPGGEVVSATSTWTLGGTLALDAEELENGRLLLRWEDGSGTEFLPLICGRPTEKTP